MLDRILSLVAPHLCIGCERQGAVLCMVCMGKILRMPSVCYRCGTKTVDFATCPACRSQTKLAAVRVVTNYEGLAKDAVWKLKFSGARAASIDMGQAMAALVADADETIIVHIPTATSRVRVRGYDQAQLLAHEVARRTGLPHIAHLARLDQKRQVGASRKERLAQLSDAFRLRSHGNITDARILLVDDVLTTGATLETAAAVLKKAGAKRVEAVVFARA
jgi:ComF family protein